MFEGYSGDIVIQLSSFDGRILQQQKLRAVSAKVVLQSIDISAYPNGVYMITVIDEKGNRKTERMIIQL